MFFFVRGQNEFNLLGIPCGSNELGGVEMEKANLGRHGAVAEFGS